MRKYFLILKRVMAIENGVPSELGKDHGKTGGCAKGPMTKAQGPRKTQYPMDPHGLVSGFWDFHSKVAGGLSRLAMRAPQDWIRARAGAFRWITSDGRERGRLIGNCPRSKVQSLEKMNIEHPASNGGWGNEDDGSSLLAHLTFLGRNHTLRNRRGLNGLPRELKFRMEL